MNGVKINISKHIRKDHVHWLYWYIIEKNSSPLKDQSYNVGIFQEKTILKTVKYNIEKHISRFATCWVMKTKTFTATVGKLNTCDTIKTIGYLRRYT